MKGEGENERLANELGGCSEVYEHPFEILKNVFTRSEAPASECQAGSSASMEIWGLEKGFNPRGSK